MQTTIPNINDVLRIDARFMQRTRLHCIGVDCSWSGLSELETERSAQFQRSQTSVHMQPKIVCVSAGLLNLTAKPKTNVTAFTHRLNRTRCAGENQKKMQISPCTSSNIKPHDVPESPKMIAYTGLKMELSEAKCGIYASYGGYLRGTVPH